MPKGGCGAVDNSVKFNHRGTYSIRYNVGVSSIAFALDWDFTKRDMWSATSKDYGGAQRYSHEENNEKIHEVLLLHFGLKAFSGEFPIEKIKFMSPRALAEERRRIERDFCLPRISMTSNTLGYHIEADN